MLKRLLLGLMLALCFGIESQSAVAAGVQLFTNNAVTTLAAPATSGATSLTVSSSSLFPAPTGGNWFIATLEHIVSGVVTVNEIVQVTNVSGTTWTVVRGQEGTSAVAWLSGDTVALLPTAGGLQQFVQSNTAFGSGTTTRVAYGAWVGISGCVAATGFTNVGMTCVRTGAGNYTMTVTGFTHYPICTGNIFAGSNSLYVVDVNAFSATTVQVNTVSGPSSSTDNDFVLMCVGN